MDIAKMLNTQLHGDPRYQPEQLKAIFGYDFLYRGAIEVEIVVLTVLAEIGIIPKREIELFTPEIVEKVRAIWTTEVDEVERNVTGHDVRALVRLIQKEMDSRLARWVHIPLTSYDPIDTGRILLYRRAYQQALLPSLRETIRHIAYLTKTYADVIQIGRTHLQHALPITVGFWFACILNRILYNEEKMRQFADELVGKISGAVGASNAIYGLGIAEKCGAKSFEERVLEKLGLKPARISTQILQPEPLAYFLTSCFFMTAAIGQFGRDGRNLMRSEIGEIIEGYEDTQVGSSTMAGKRNPRWFEYLEGRWLATEVEIAKVHKTLVSEHQRDLTGSSILRNLPVILVNLQEQLNTLLRKDKDGAPFLRRIKVDKQACDWNFRLSEKHVLGEPLYIAMQMAGYEGDAHELITRKIAPEAKRKNISLIEELEKYTGISADVNRAFHRIPQEVRELFRHPERYTGNAADKARQIADLAKRRVSEM